MATREKIYGILGFQVVSLEEGALLGKVSALLLDPATRSLTCLRVKPPSGDEAYVKVEHVRLLGRDVVLVEADKALVELDDKAVEGLRDVADLRGILVGTLGGRHIGKLLDIDVVAGTWALSSLLFEGRRRLPVEPADVTLGVDQVLVPAGYAERIVAVEKEGGPGLLGRIAESAEGAAAAFKRTFGLGGEEAKAAPEAKSAKPAKAAGPEVKPTKAAPEAKSAKAAPEAKSAKPAAPEAKPAKVAAPAAKPATAAPAKAK